MRKGGLSKVGTIVHISRASIPETMKTTNTIEVLAKNLQKNNENAAARPAEIVRLDREYWRRHFDELLERLNMIIKVSRVEFRREVHKGTGEIMVSILDSETGEMLRQIPPERVLDMLAEMMKHLGLNVDLEA